jgi:hypothetical protein
MRAETAQKTNGEPTTRLPPLFQAAIAERLAKDGERSSPGPGHAMTDKPPSRLAR